MTKVPPGVGPRFPQVVVLFGATGDLAHRKLLPGLFRLACVGFIPACRIVGVSLEDLDTDAFRKIARAALDEFSTHKVTDADWEIFSACLEYVPLKSGAPALRAAVERAEKAIGGASRDYAERTRHASTSRCRAKLGCSKKRRPGIASSRSRV